MPKRFKVALSFPGEYRHYVESVARELARSLTRDAVFYDRFHESELARPNLDTHLQTIYHQDSELIVVFLCSEYDDKEWCGIEFRSIRDLIKRRQDDMVMFVRLDTADVKGVFSVDGYIDTDGRSPRSVAKLIIQRLGQNQVANP